MKNFVVIVLFLIFLVTQFASILSDIVAPVVHAVCYGKVFKRRSTGTSDQVLVMDSAAFRQAQTDTREIRIRGELFDIVSITIRRDSVQLHLASDEFETHFFNIVHHIREAVKKASGPHHHGKHLQSWLLKLYCPNEATANLLFPGFILVLHKLPLTPGLQAGIHNRHLLPPDLFI